MYYFCNNCGGECKLKTVDLTPTGVGRYRSVHTREITVSACCESQFSVRAEYDKKQHEEQEE